MAEQRAGGPRDVQFGELPELTRGLRAFGSSRHSGAFRRGSITSRVHQHFFQPLLDARKQATDATTPHAAVRAFDSEELTRALDRLLDRIVAEWPDKRPAVRRALRTGLRERAEILSRAITELGERGAAVLNAHDDAPLDAWREWTAQLVSTFHAADRSWMAIQPIIEALPPRKER